MLMKKSAPIGAWNYDRPTRTNQPTDQQTVMRVHGEITLPTRRQGIQLEKRRADKHF